MSWEDAANIASSLDDLLKVKEISRNYIETSKSLKYS